MCRTSACNQQGASTTTLASSWLARYDDQETDVGALVPPPGMEALLDALASDDPATERVADALTVYAWECASTHADLTCSLAEISDLWNILESTGQNRVSLSQAHHWFTDAWVDAVAAERGTPGIEPLSGLHTVGYLLGRIHELDRLAGNEPAALVALVVYWREPTSPWERIALIIEVAHTLHTKIRREATLCQFDPHTALALLPDDNRARVERGTLARAFGIEELDAPDIDVTLVPLPEDRSRVTELIVRLLDGSMGGQESRPIGWSHSRRKSLD